MYTFCLNPYNKPYENILELILYVIFDEKTCKNSWKTIKRKLEMNSKWKIMKKCNINEKNKLFHDIQNWKGSDFKV